MELVVMIVGVAAMQWSKVGETLQLGETEDFWCGAKGYLHRHLNRNEREDPRKGERENGVGRSEVHQTN